MKKVHDLDIPESVDSCPQCRAYKRADCRTYLLKDPNMPACVPYIPAIYYRPHVCCLTRLRVVQDLYLNKQLSKVYYEQWMEMNGGNYQVFGSERLMSVWQDRIDSIQEKRGKKKVKKFKLKYIQKFDLSNIILEGSHVAVIPDKKYPEVFRAQLKVPGARTNNRSKVKVFNKLFPFSSIADKNKTNIDLSSLVNTLRFNGFGVDVNKCLMCLPVGTFNSVAVAMLIHYVGNKCASKMFDLFVKDEATILGPEGFNKYLKAITNALRRTRRWPDSSEVTLDEVTQCSYWELCIGRSNMKSNWQEEMDNRLKIRLDLCSPLSEKRDRETNAKYIEGLRKQMKMIMQQLVSAQDIWPTFENFVKDRQSWLAGGSSGGQHIIYDDKKLPIDKKVYFETLTTEDILPWIDSEPKIEAVASEKFEQSKARAIYGTKPIDYTIMTYVIGKIEPKLARVDGVECGLTSVDEMRCLIRRSKVIQRAQLECSMLDYADFNRQHTMEAQALVFECLSEKLRMMNVHPDVIKASDWCAKAMMNQWVTFPMQDKPTKVIQGLFSGNRGTNFINTLLNVAYYRYARTWVSEKLNIKWHFRYNLHQGDDVWLSSDSRLLNIAEYTVLKACGFMISEIKQQQSISCGEFLRVYFTESGLKGFLARSLGTFITRPLQAERDVSPDARAIGINSQIMILYRRGLSLKACVMIWDAIMRHHLTSKIGEDNIVRIPSELAKTSALNNGLDIGYPMTMAPETNDKPKIPRLRLTSKKMEAEVPRHTSHAWVCLISEKFQKEMKAERFEMALHRSNLMGSLPGKEKVQCRVVFHEEFREWRDKIKEHEIEFNSQRSFKVFEDWYNSEEEDLRAKIAINELFDYCGVKNDKTYQDSPFYTMHSAITVSPFKDVHHASTALGVDLLDAAYVCANMCKNDDRAAIAYHQLKYYENTLGRQVTNKILDGAKGVGSVFEAIFNPIPLSYLCKMAEKLAIDDAIANNLRDVKEWDRLLYYTQLRVMKTAIQDKRLVELSGY